MLRGYYNPTKAKPAHHRWQQRKADRRTRALATLDQGFLSVWLTGFDELMETSRALENQKRRITIHQRTW